MGQLQNCDFNTTSKTQTYPMSHFSFSINGFIFLILCFCERAVFIKLPDHKHSRLKMITNV